MLIQRLLQTVLISSAVAFVVPAVAAPSSALPLCGEHADHADKDKKNDKKQNKETAEEDGKDNKKKEAKDEGDAPA